MVIICYTDGSCRGNKKGSIGGCAVYFADNDPRNISYSLDNATNNICELSAIEKAIDIINDKDDIIIYSDSTYSINCITKWYSNWLNNPFLMKDKENIELIGNIYNKIQLMNHNVQLIYVKRGTHIGNIKADKMARECY